MRRIGAALIAALAWTVPLCAQQSLVGVPLPEHPRPDFERAAWQNLNGPWSFRFDPDNAGEAQGWPSGFTATHTIQVPFPWGSPLSGVPDSARIAWYARSIQIPPTWNGERVFLVVGAADWLTTAWVDGHQLGTHQGGYTPFEFELTQYVKPGTTHQLVLRIDDVDRKFKLEGKQGYGNARGIWQTVYLEARGSSPVAYMHFTPQLANHSVAVSVQLLEPAARGLDFTLRFNNAAIPVAIRRIAKGSTRVDFTVAIPEPHLWTLDDPFLYEVTGTIGAPGIRPDSVNSYFGMRSISVATLPGTDYSYVALNGQPIYLQLALDQAYHPDGFYTFPTDDFMRAEILRAKQIGLNGLREHVKVEAPRKLYWADKLGLLIMSDVPNSWGEPDPEMRAEIESTLRAMIARDYNHPAIFQWVTFNETWGLFTHEGQKDSYSPQTQNWVVSVVKLAKSLDSSRLVEDNSVCCGEGHTLTDVNSWHWYLPGYAWEHTLDVISDSTYPGSTWNFEPGYQQARQPNINSEFGNVWGYKGSTGDVDWSWDYHRAVNAFRRHPRVAGWLYTEHHDVINEWNGYWRFDRTNKETGFGELVPGMSLRDLQSPLYIAVGNELSQAVRPGERVSVPLYASFMSGSTALGDSLRLETELRGWNSLGEPLTYATSTRLIPYHPYLAQSLAPLDLVMPREAAVLLLTSRLEDLTGHVLQRNFTTFVVEAPDADSVRTAQGQTVDVVRFDPARFTDAKWSLRQWNVLDSLKVDGAGSGYFEYHVPWPGRLKRDAIRSVSLVAEVSAKQLFGKDRPDAGKVQGDFMLGQGTHDPSLNPNSYPMTDEKLFPSMVTVTVNGVSAGMKLLSDDPADSRGILSWHYQLHDGRLREAGSYGELLQVPIPAAALERAAAAGEFVIRFEVPASLPGGLAIYGRRFGRYPLDPTLIFVRRGSEAASTPGE